MKKIQYFAAFALRSCKDKRRVSWDTCAEQEKGNHDKHPAQRRIEASHNPIHQKGSDIANPCPLSLPHNANSYVYPQSRIRVALSWAPRSRRNRWRTHE